MSRATMRLIGALAWVLAPALTFLMTAAAPRKPRKVFLGHHHLHRRRRPAEPIEVGRQLLAKSPSSQSTMPVYSLSASSAASERLHRAPAADVRRQARHHPAVAAAESPCGPAASDAAEAAGATEAAASDAAEAALTRRTRTERHPAGAVPSPLSTSWRTFTIFSSSGRYSLMWFW